jgi:hypothetical protein
LLKTRGNQLATKVFAGFAAQTNGKRVGMPTVNGFWSKICIKWLSLQEIDFWLSFPSEGTTNAGNGTEWTKITMEASE